MQVFKVLAVTWLLVSRDALARAIPVETEAYIPAELSGARAYLLDFDDYPLSTLGKEYTLAEIKASMAEHTSSRVQQNTMEKVKEVSPVLLKRASSERKIKVEFEVDCPALPARAARTFIWGAKYDRDIGKVIYDPILHIDQFGPNREIFDNRHEPGTYRHQWTSVVCLLIQDQFCTYRFKGHFSGDFALDESWFHMHFWRSGQRPGRDPTVTETCVPASPHSNTCSAVLPMTHMCEIETFVTHLS